MAKGETHKTTMIFSKNLWFYEFKYKMNSMYG